MKPRAWLKFLCNLFRRDPDRLETITVKVPKEATGLKGALYVHASKDAKGRLREVTISSPGKFMRGQLETILNAVAEAMTEAVRG